MLPNDTFESTLPSHSSSLPHPRYAVVQYMDQENQTCDRSHANLYDDIAFRHPKYQLLPSLR